MTEQWPSGYPTAPEPDGGWAPVPAPGPGSPGYGSPGYGPPGYGSPGYPPYGPPGYPPGYGPPGYPPFGPPGWRPTNTTAVLALVLAFVFAPAGLVLGLVARKQIRRTGEAGDGLALAGAIVGGIGTAFFVALILFWVIAFISLTSGGFAP